MTYPPKDVAALTGKHEKTVRAWLRQTFPRDFSQKSTRWEITEAQKQAAVSRFT